MRREARNRIVTWSVILLVAASGALWARSELNAMEERNALERDIETAQWDMGKEVCYKARDIAYPYLPRDIVREIEYRIERLRRPYLLEVPDDYPNSILFDIPTRYVEEAYMRRHSEERRQMSMAEKERNIEAFMRAPWMQDLYDLKNAYDDMLFTRPDLDEDYDVVEVRAKFEAARDALKSLIEE